MQADVLSGRFLAERVRDHETNRVCILQPTAVPLRVHSGGEIRRSRGCIKTVYHV